VVTMAIPPVGSSYRCSPAYAGRRRWLVAGVLRL